MKSKILEKQQINLEKLQIGEIKLLQSHEISINRI